VIIDEAGYAAITEPNGDIDQAAMIARNGDSGWSEDARKALLQAVQKPWGQSVLQNDPRSQEVFDSLADAERDRTARVQAMTESFAHTQFVPTGFM
jgi:hypothetical protein